MGEGLGEGVGVGVGAGFPLKAVAGVDAAAVVPVTPWQPAKYSVAASDATAIRFLPTLDPMTYLAQQQVSRCKSQEAGGLDSDSNFEPKNLTSIFPTYFSHLLHQKELCATLVVMSRRHDGHLAYVVLSRDRHVLASRVTLRCHGRHCRYSHSCGDHRHDGGELSALEDYVG